MQIDHSDTLYDVAIIGGGIAGAGIARDAALRGLKVVLLEKNSFGSGASGKSSKLIHGGIRYLELFWNALKHGRSSEALKNLKFVLYSLKEEKTLRKIAPGLVEPLPLIIPIYKHSPRKAISIYLGVYFYFILGLFAGSASFPKIYFGKKAILHALPGLRAEGLCGGVMIKDSRTDDRELVQATILSATRNSAQCFERALVTAYEYDALNKRYIVSSWMPDGDIHRFFSKKLINATGPWIDKVRTLRGEINNKYISPVAGSHIEIPKFLPYSVILQAKDGRIFFVINTGEKARIGTTEWACPDPDNVHVPDEDIEYLLESLSRYFLAGNFTRSNILKTDAGVRPLPSSSGAADFNSIPREHEIKVDDEGVIHVIGVKLTDHRRAAQQVVDTLFPALMGPSIKRHSVTAEIRLDAQTG